MEFTDHLIFDTLTNRLVSYSLSQKRVSFFSFDTDRWDLVERNKEEPNYYNHARTYNPADSIFVSLIQNLPTIIVEIVKAVPQIIAGIVNAFTSVCLF